MGLLASNTISENRRIVFLSIAGVKREGEDSSPPAAWWQQWLQVNELSKYKRPILCLNDVICYRRLPKRAKRQPCHDPHRPLMHPPAPPVLDLKRGPVISNSESLWSLKWRVFAVHVWEWEWRQEMWHPNSTFTKTNSATNKQAISTWKKTRSKLRSKWGWKRSLHFLKQCKIKFLISCLHQHRSSSVFLSDNKYKYHDLIKALNPDIKMTKRKGITSKEGTIRKSLVHVEKCFVAERHFRQVLLAVLRLLTEADTCSDETVRIMKPECTQSMW